MQWCLRQVFYFCVKVFSVPVSLCTKRRFVVVELDRSLTSVPSKERLCVRACFVLPSAPVHLHPVCVWHNVSVSIVLIHQQKGFPSGFPHCCLTENFSSQSAQTHTSGERGRCVLFAQGQKQHLDWSIQLNSPHFQSWQLTAQTTIFISSSSSSFTCPSSLPFTSFLFVPLHLSLVLLS